MAVKVGGSRLPGVQRSAGQVMVSVVVRMVSRRRGRGGVR
jgi:hypothetical protein